MPEFFLELFSEEIPARMQRQAAQVLFDLCNSVFLGFLPQNFQVFYGPRRLALSATVNADDSAGGTGTAEARGPREGAPDAAIEGFVRKYEGNHKDLFIENGYFVLRRKLAATPAREKILTELGKNLVRFAWPKSMRWGQSEDFTWVRPLRRIVCLLDGEVIPLKLGPVTASNETEGHRFLAPGAFTVSSAAEWLEKLEENYVVADQDERKLRIRNGLKAKAEKLGLSIVKDEALLDEVTGLVEWPVPLIGSIGAEFMDLPPEVRELSMKVNQKYFALRDATGNPAPYFAFVANIAAPDGGAAIISGNERVLRARLSDARHFWDRDLKTPLNELLPKLDEITFHAKVGSQGERATRISKLAEQIADAMYAHGYECVQARQAGLLCKADLVTGMVGEFPELQGIMGGYYAERMVRGWDGSIVGPAIRTHYQPKGPQDAVPVGVIPCAVALADKLDTLVQFFSINEKPTGSGDPYALRRAALGVIRIILENQLALNLKPLLNHDQSLFDFIIERLRVKLRGEGRRFDILDAVLGAGTDDDLVRIMRKVDAVTEFLDRPDGANLLAAYRRAANILRIEDAKDGPHTAEGVFRHLQSPEADNLRDALENIDVVADYNAGSYGPVMAWLAGLRAPVDEFFDNVTINDPESDKRRNHLRLLARLRDTMHLIADFSKIEG